MPNKNLEVLVLPCIENISEIVKDLNVTVTKGYYSNLEFIFKNNQAVILHNGRDIKTFSFVWLSSFWATRDLASTVKLYLDKYNVPNTYVEHASSKLSDSMNFVLLGLPCPNTYFTEGYNIEDHIEDLENTCCYPMIMKDLKGCGGENAAFIKNRNELLCAIENRNNSRKYFFQSYIVNDYDWGILVANNKVVSGEKSYPNNGEFRNNVGATEVFVDVEKIPDEIKDIALNASNTLGLSWSRSDIIVQRGSEKPYLLEVNRFPGITSQSSEVNGASIFLANNLDLFNLIPLQSTSLIPEPKLKLVTIS